MPNANDSPERLADLLARYLKRSGIDSRIQQNAVIEQWASLVGPELAAVTRALSVSEDGTLFAAAKSHAWMSELAMMERDLLAAVNVITGDHPIRKLRWSLLR